MKRRIEMCRRCQLFCETSQIVSWINGRTGDSGRKKEIFIKCTIDGFSMSMESFERMDVPVDCIMKAEYLMNEWNNEKTH